MPSTEDLVLDRIIASLQEARIWKDKPRELRAEIGSLKAERDRAKAEVDRARAELRDPSLDRQRHEQAQKIRREIKDREAERDVLTERVAKQRCQLDCAFRRS